MTLNDFKYNSDLDFDLALDAAGNMTLDFACGHEAVSNLIRARLQREVDWDLVDNQDVQVSTRAQIIREVVLGTDGVSFVDMSDFSPQLIDGVMVYGQICPTIDCDNSKPCEIAL